MLKLEKEIGKLQVGLVCVPRFFSLLGLRYYDVCRI